MSFEKMTTMGIGVERTALSVMRTITRVAAVVVFALSMALIVGRIAVNAMPNLSSLNSISDQAQLQ